MTSVDGVTRSAPDWARGTAIASLLAEGHELLEIESAIYGLHHAEIGAQLAERWNFPDRLCDAIRHHHLPSESRVDPLLASVGQLGEYVAQRFGGESDTPACSLRPDALQCAGMTEEMLLELEGPLRAELSKAKRILEIA